MSLELRKVRKKQFVISWNGCMNGMLLLMTFLDILLVKSHTKSKNYILITCEITLDIKTRL